MHWFRYVGNHADHRHVQLAREEKKICLEFHDISIYYIEKKKFQYIILKYHGIPDRSLLEHLYTQDATWLSPSFRCHNSNQ